MAHADLLAEILRLPAEERARLALELIRNLDTPAEAAAADACAEIARPGTEADAGIAATMTVDEYRARATASSRTWASMNLRIDRLAVARLIVRSTVFSWRLDERVVAIHAGSD